MSIVEPVHSSVNSTDAPPGVSALTSGVVERSARSYEFPCFRKGADNDLKNAWERAPEGSVISIKPPVIRPIALPPNAGPAPPGSPGGGDKSLMSDAGTGEPEAGGVRQGLLSFDEDEEAERHKLGQLPATAIAGNDITSSCLYSAGITLKAGGIMAPFSSAILCFVLYLFRDIYSEVCTGLPMNGGTYNALLNTTSKSLAALASVLSLVSYTATAVVSAASAAEYLHYEWSAVNVVGLTLGILIFFAVLNLIGISESANVATGMFVFHLLTMAVLCVASLIFVIRDGGQVMKGSYHSADVSANPTGNYALNVYFGYCAALLGVTGFETSSNYIEEQRRDVFPKTLRNMWIAVSILNPVLTVLSIGVLDIKPLVGDYNYALAAMAEVSAGPWLRYWVVIDGTIVLAGAVLTAYVGVGGLLRRMAHDQLMPHFFTHTNRWRKTNHWIIAVFCLVTCSLRLLVNDLDTLGGVYAIAFLGVMTLFSVSNLAVKYKRASLPRHPITPTWQVVLAMIFVVAGMVGNIARSTRTALYFFLYFFVFSIVVVLSRLRIDVMRFCSTALEKLSDRAVLFFRTAVGEIRETPVIYFTNQNSVAKLNKMILYVQANDDTNRIYVVHCTKNPESPESRLFIKGLEESCAALDRVYPKLTISMVIYEGEFDPKATDFLAGELGVTKNFMFITCPSHRFPHGISRFGGLRVITY